MGVLALVREAGILFGDTMTLRVIVTALSSR
jgi:hypothetical protein